MKIELSKQEMKDLIELLYFGSFFFDSSRNTYPDKREKYDQLIQKFHKIAYQNGITKYLQSVNNEIHVNRDFEDTEYVVNVIEEFENESFWHNLISYLADRDLKEKMSPDEFKNLTLEERIKTHFDFEEPYVQEFVENGLKNLKILNTDLSFLKK